jgi:ribosome-associated heat shock protein Hsp15
MEEGVRIDKWLWAVRIFKTRSQATDACRSGNVKIGGQVVKPSRMIRRGEELEIHLRPVNKRVMVAGLVEHRIGPKLVADFMVDLTPEEEYEKLKMMKEMHFEYRQRGLGRPTKLQRREIESLKKVLGQ